MASDEYTTRDILFESIIIGTYLKPKTWHHTEQDRSSIYEISFLDI
jgi:hypothetical protein